MRPLMAYLAETCEYYIRNFFNPSFSIMEKKSINPVVTVYFDGVCQLCSKEIDYYKKIAPGGSFEWIDIARNGNALREQNISQQQALLYLHAKDFSGKIHVGVDAFRLIWKGLPRWKYLGALLGISPINYLAKAIYSRFARLRFQRSKHCDIEFLKSNRFTD